MKNSNGNNGQRRAPELSGQELEEVRKELEHQLQLRRTAPPSSIFITVYGEEQRRAGTALNTTGQASFTAPERAQLSEVWSRQNLEAVLLATCLLSYSGQDKKVFLEGGQLIGFNVRFIEGATGEGVYEIGMQYKETKLRRIISARLGSFAGGVRRPREVYALLAFLLIAFGFGIFGLFSFIGKTVPAGNHAQEVGNLNGGTAAPTPLPEVVASASPSVPNDLSSNPKTQDGKDGQAKHSQAINAPHKERAGGGDLTKKTNEDRPDSKSLLPVNAIYVGDLQIYKEVRDDDVVRAAQVAALRESDLFSASSDRGSAHYFLRAVSDFRGAGKYIQPRIYNIKGSLVWVGPMIRVAGDTPEERKAESLNIAQEIKNALVADKTDEMKEKGNTLQPTQ
jgi:hypothetical protein